MYFIILALTLLGVVGALLNVNASPSRRSGPDETVILILFGLVVLLTILILYPIGRGLFRATAPRTRATPGKTALRTLGIIAILLVVAPTAFFIVFFAVCTATLVVLR